MISVRRFGTYADGDVEGTNNSWSRWTPSGHLQVTITNPNAIDLSEKGKAHYLDFPPVGNRNRPAACLVLQVGRAGRARSRIALLPIVQKPRGVSVAGLFRARA